MTRLPKPSFANVVALIALFVSLGGTVYAAAKIDGKTIRVGSIPANRLKADSLGGAQVNEAGLGQVPAAARAETATRALSAESAETARRGEEAARATTALRALSVDVATTAGDAKRADFAAETAQAPSLGGKSPGSFLQRCEPGATRGVVLVDVRVQQQPAPVGFGCGGAPQVVRGAGQVGEFVVTFPGVTEAIPIASAFGINRTAAVRGTGPVFTVDVFNTATGARLSNEAFTLAVF